MHFFNSTTTNHQLLTVFVLVFLVFSSPHLSIFFGILPCNGLATSPGCTRHCFGDIPDPHVEELSGEDESDKRGLLIQKIIVYRNSGPEGNSNVGRLLTLEQKQSGGAIQRA
ncbi:hypothetical protein ILYODFUR_037374 [Ilyodon furcidens]|uniref:Uncharacterized protein n=1 Tax=Ilyodon furcidens TaxID=33524 RepID=A0ABV0U3R3_9TELE